MDFMELKNNGEQYQKGYLTALERSYKEAREDICKYMYKKKKVSLSMAEICSVLHESEKNNLHHCTTYGLGLGYPLND